MVLTASEAELLKGNANVIELLPGSDDYKLNNTIAINKRNIIIIDDKYHTYTHM